MHALALTDSTAIDIIKIKEEEEVEEGVEKEQDTGTVEMVKRPQDCNQGKGPGKICVVPHGQFPAYETTASKTTVSPVMWVIAPTPNKGFVTIQCCDGEQGFCLEHVEGQLHMTCNRGADSQMWLVEKHNRSYTVSCYSGTQRRFLSHGCGGLSFQDVCFGANELWKLAE